MNSIVIQKIIYKLGPLAPEIIPKLIAILLAEPWLIPIVLVGSISFISNLVSQYEK